MLTIYHNARCSKSRQTLAIIQEANAEVTIVEYLKNPLNKNQLQTLVSLLNVTPVGIMRTKEAEFKTMNLAHATYDELITAMVTCPKLIERPIVTSTNKAIIGRPPENVLALLD
jgi:arsenate reductase